MRGVVSEVMMICVLVVVIEMDDGVVGTAIAILEFSNATNGQKD